VTGLADSNTMMHDDDDYDDDSAIAAQIKT